MKKVARFMSVAFRLVFHLAVAYAMMSVLESFLFKGFTSGGHPDWATFAAIVFTVGSPFGYMVIALDRGLPLSIPLLVEKRKRMQN